MRRTYNFLFTHLSVLSSTGQFPAISTDVNTYDGGWLPASFLNLDYDHLSVNASGFQHFWTSPLNMYSVSNISAVNARVFGCTKYTVIRLDWLGMLRCQFSGFFTEVTKQIQEDFQKYGYWRPGRITVKLIPKFGRPPSFQTAPAGYTFQSSAPLYRTGAVNVPISAGTILQRGANGNTNTALYGITGGVAGENGWMTDGTCTIVSGEKSAALPQLTAEAASSISGTVTTSSEANLYVNHLARRLVGYLIPSGYDTVGNTGDSSAYAQMYSSILSSASQSPSIDWLSSFRNVGYKRQILSTRRSCKWSYKYSRYIGKVGLPYLGQTTSYNNVPYIQNPNLVVTRSYSEGSKTPYEIIHDPARLTWIRGDYMRFGVWRREDAGHPALNDPSRLPMIVYIPQYQPLDYCNVYIPGLDVADLFNLYDVRFSYTCKFSSRVFDGE